MKSKKYATKYASKIHSLTKSINFAFEFIDFYLSMLDTSRESYERFYIDNVDWLPIFVKPTWMDAATIGGTWVPLTILNKEGTPLGICPFQKKKKLGIPYYTAPMLSPKSGLWLKPSFDFISHFPKHLQKSFPFHAYFLYRFFQKKDSSGSLIENVDRKNLHTFVLNTEGGLEALENKLHKTTKRNIRVATSTLQIELNSHQDIFLSLYMKCAEEKGFAKPQMKQCLKSILEYSIPRNGTLLCALNKKNVLEAGLFVVFDQNRMYGVASAASKTSSKNHASRLLLWEAIKLSQSKSLVFDFGGGNIPSIARFFESFGAEKERYFQHTVYRNNLIKNYLT